jgi:hypothetical protein
MRFLPEFADGIAGEALVEVVVVVVVVAAAAPPRLM